MTSTLNLQCYVSNVDWEIRDKGEFWLRKYLFQQRDSLNYKLRNFTGRVHLIHSKIYKQPHDMIRKNTRFWMEHVFNLS